MFTASNISSIDIKMTMTFFRLRKIPKMPIVNRIAATAQIVRQTDFHGRLVPMLPSFTRKPHGGACLLPDFLKKTSDRRQRPLPDPP